MYKQVTYLPAFYALAIPVSCYISNVFYYLLITTRYGNHLQTNKQLTFCEEVKFNFELLQLSCEIIAFDIIFENFVQTSDLLTFSTMS